MADINHVVLVGRLTRDAELKYTNTGFPVAKLGIAINRRRKKDETWVEEAHFFNVTVFGKTAESLQPYLTKGKQVGIEGELRQSRWEQNGQPRSSVDIIANNIQLLGSRAGGSNQGGNYQSSGSNMDAAVSNAPPIDDFEDDIPF